MRIEKPHHLPCSQFTIPNSLFTIQPESPGKPKRKSGTDASERSETGLSQVFLRLPRASSASVASFRKRGLYQASGVPRRSDSREGGSETGLSPLSADGGKVASYKTERRLSARETYYWLRLIVATDIVPAEKLAPLVQESNELVAILTTIIKTTKENTR